MNRYLKDFLYRGLIFGGFGPIVVAIVFMCISLADRGFSLTASQILLATVSSYLLAFIQAGVTVFNQIEHWSTVKSLLCHFVTLYAAYSVCYVVNSWIPFEPMVLVIFSAVFVLLFFVIWGIVYLSVRATSKRLNSQLKG
ncbi:MAG: DUF3021 domain-containing protein [Clostridia bacterium]|nr:DUF3021 domain-containing protein [Clostridia bacterium]